MPKKSAVPPELAIETIKKFMQYFKSDPLPAWSHEVWKDMSVALNKKWSFEACYLNLYYDRNCVLSTARKEMGLVVPPKFDQNNNSDLEESFISNGKSDGDASFQSSFELKNNEKKLDTFDLVLTEQQWNEMKPDIIKSDTKANSGRPKLKLKPGVWTNEISFLFWQHFRLPCAFVFKRSEVILSPDDTTYIIKIIGSCKSKVCGNTFRGDAEKQTCVEGLTIQIKTRDTRFENHELVKRPLNGQRRKQIRKELKAEGCSVWRKRYARENMRFGETEPPSLPSGNVCQQARLEEINAELGVKKEDGRDLVRTIEEMALNPEYAGFIHDVGLLPFHVTYSTPAQLYAYKEYCRLNKISIISLDATGSVVKKIDQTGRRGHIFLYAIVINFDGTTIAVHQMLSERHTTEFIELWLRQWLRGGAPKPSQAVCDYSRAFLCGISLAFNNQTIKTYVNTMFSAISGVGVQKRPDTLIRVDVAHLIHAVCRWSCWKLVRQACIKDFFVRCVAMMVECTKFSNFEEIFYLTCVVALQTHQDAELVYSEVRTAKEARKKLEDFIAVRGINIDTNLKSLSEDELKHLEEEHISEPDELDESSSCIEKWVDGQVAKAGNIQRDGEDLNPFYLPEFVKLLSSRAKEFPLWTSVGMACGTPHATSSYVEGYFNDIKTRVLKNTNRPLRVDKFLIMQARDIAGATSLFSSKMINFNAEQCVPSIESKRSVDISYLSELPSGNRGKRLHVSFERSADGEAGSNINEEKTPFHQVLSSNKEDRISKSPTESVQLLTKYNQVEDVPCFAETAWNGIGVCCNDSDLLATENWRGKDKADKLESDTFDENISCFVELSSNDIEALVDGLTSPVVKKLHDDFETNNLNGKILNGCDVLENWPELSAGLNIANENFEPMSTSLVDHSYCTTGKSTDSASNTLNLQSTNYSEFELNLKGRSKSSARTSPHSVINSIVHRDTKLTVSDSPSINMPSESELLDIQPTFSAKASQLGTKSDERQLCNRDPRKISKFFRAYPEIRHRNTLVAQKKKSTLLPHGSRCLPVKIKENGKINSYYVTNTCSLDALLHVFMEAAINDANYFNFLKSSKNCTLELVCNLIEKGATPAVFQKRVLILKNLYSCKPHIQTEERVVSYVINATDSIANVANKTLASEPSVENTEICSHCKGRTYGTICLAPNHRIIANKGFGYLETALHFRSPIFKIKCRDPCLGQYTWLRKPGNHIMIELDIRSTLKCTTGKTCALKQMPATLTLQHDEDISSEYRFV